MGKNHGPWRNGRSLRTERLTCSVPVPVLTAHDPSRLPGPQNHASLQTFAPERVRPVCNAAVAGGADLVKIGKFSDF